MLRPGRIDINIELKKASTNIVKQILEFFYDTQIDNELYNNLDYQLTPAEVMNICQNNIFNIKNAIKLINK